MRSRATIMKKITLSLLAFLLSVAAAPAQILRVDDDAPAGGDGLSWPTAFRHLQDALAAAASDPGVSEIRVAAGTHRPDRDEGGVAVPGDRLATFGLRSGLAVRGGFEGLSGAHPDARDPGALVTLLSGDLLGDDAPGWLNYAENAWHVVTATNVDASGVLDGVTVSGGNAYDQFLGHVSGSGVRAEGGAPSFRDCVFRANIAYSGPGMTLIAANATLDRCTFDSNLAWIGRGGALYVATPSDPVLRDTLFVGNRSYGASSVGDGGAIFIEFDCAVTLVSCRFVSNSSSASQPAFSNGGAIASLGDGLLAVSCVFERNSALVGGAVWTGRESKFVSCFFDRNTSLAGGGLCNFLNSVQVVNCVFAGNDAEDGGGILNSLNVHLRLVNSILWGNTSPGAAGAYVAQINNLDDSATVDAGFTCIEGLFTPEPGEDPRDPANFPGCIEDDPLLAGIGDARLLPGSPCLDAGINRGVPRDTRDVDADGDTAESVPFDLSGLPRFADDPAAADVGRGAPPIADMGAFERAPCADGGVSVLAVNGTNGPVVTIGAGFPITVRLDASPAGPTPGAYALWVWRGAAVGSHPLAIGGETIGCTVAPTPFDPLLAPQPWLALRGGLGSEFTAGVREIASPPTAPWTRTRASGFSRPIDLVLQGVIEDANSPAAAGLSTTNAIVLRIR